MSPKITQPKPVDPFLKARRAGVPVIAIESADPAATITKCQQALNGRHQVTPLLQHDILRGLFGINKPGKAMAQQFADNPTDNPAVCIDALCKAAQGDRLAYIPEGEEKKCAAIVFMVHANRYLDDTGCMQAVWNARTVFEPEGATLVLLGPVIKLPAELKNDVVVISEPLPDAGELGEILDKITSDAEIAPDKITDRDITIDTMSGTSAFGARQILAMSITRDGIDSDALWTRKKKMIEQCPGLAVWKGGSTFEDLGGLDNLKLFLTRVLTSGATPVRAIGFIDEIEKGLAGASGDLSGTSQDQLQVFLKVMQDYNIPGIILVGHAGTGKSEIAKAAGNVAKCPVISIDTGAMKDSLVGGSELRIRQAMDVFKAVSQGKGLFIATCNRISSLPPELRRRFTLGTFFVDLPSPEERTKIWPLWVDRFDVPRAQLKALPDADNWTGAEIRACCDVAFRTGLTLREAAGYVTPICKSAPEAIEALRKLASNRFLNASKPGLYVYNDNTQETPIKTGRKIEV
jgi:hypothetical protein